MRDLIIVALLQAAAGPPAAPAEPVAETPPAATEQVATQAPAAEPTERLRCRREPVVGTRLSQRICTTAREDQMIADQSRDMLDRVQSQMPASGN